MDGGFLVPFFSLFMKKVPLPGNIERCRKFLEYALVGVALLWNRWKESYYVNSAKYLAKTIILSWKLNHSIYLLFINIVFLEMSFKVILNPIFIKNMIIYNLI